MPNERFVVDFLVKGCFKPTTGIKPGQLWQPAPLAGEVGFANFEKLNGLMQIVIEAR
jgi:hypothetical protein